MDSINIAIGPTTSKRRSLEGQESPPTTPTNHIPLFPYLQVFGNGPLVDSWMYTTTINHHVRGCSSQESSKQRLGLRVGCLSCNAFDRLFGSCSKWTSDPLLCWYLNGGPNQHSIGCGPTSLTKKYCGWTESCLRHFEPMGSHGCWVCERWREMDFAPSTVGTLTTYAS